MPSLLTAVLAINGAALPQNITIDFAPVLAPDETGATPVEVVDIWTGRQLGELTQFNRVVPPHGNIFLAIG